MNYVSLQICLSSLYTSIISLSKQLSPVRFRSIASLADTHDGLGEHMGTLKKPMGYIVKTERIELEKSYRGQFVRYKARDSS